MKRFKEGKTFPCSGDIHMWSKLEPETNTLKIIPADTDWQFMFDFMIGW